MKLEFTIKDFEGMGFYDRKTAMEQANKRLAEMLKDAVVVYGYIGTVASTWTTNAPGKFIQENITHKGLLINIEEIKKECKHEPQIRLLITGEPVLLPKCKCGAELVGEWREK